MKRLFFFFSLSACLVLAVLTCSSPADARGKKPVVILPDGARVTVDHLADGDTITVLTADGIKVKVRVQGIDCPESGHNPKCDKKGKEACSLEIPKGQKAKSRAVELLKQGAKITLQSDTPGQKLGTDRYGRTLAFVRLADGRDFGLILVKEGLCQDYSWKYPHAREREYRKAQQPNTAPPPTPK